MTFKELVKINVPRSILIFCLYILYAVAGSMGEYLFKDSLNNILKGNLNGYLFWTFIQAGMEIGRQFYYQLQQLLSQDKPKTMFIRLEKKLLSITMLLQKLKKLPKCKIN